MRNFIRKSLSPNQKSHKLAKLFGEQEAIIEEDEKEDSARDLLAPVLDTVLVMNKKISEVGQALPADV